MVDFIAIDFEIANNNLNSACSMGMVFVDNNKIVDKKYFLIQPPILELDKRMSEIHGLTLDDLKDALKFDEVWGKIRHYFNGDTYIIAHNAQFDMSVLKNCLIKYSLPIPEFQYACSIPISTRACRGEGIGNSLKDRTEYFGLKIEDHHNALSDTIACAELVLKCIETKRRKSINSYFSTYNSISIKSFSELKAQTTFGNKSKKKRFDSVKVTDISPNNTEFDKNHPFFEKQIVFTGELTIDRKEAMQRTADVGGIIRSGVSRLTNFLVVGKQDKSIVGDDGLSTKEEKAYALIEKGYDIKIIKEDEFISLLDSMISIKEK